MKKVIAGMIEKLQRPLITGQELSKTYGDLFDLLDENGYLHDGEREMLSNHLAEKIYGEIAVLKALKEEWENSDK